MSAGNIREIDQFDQRILDALVADGRMSVTDLARAFPIRPARSGSSGWMRMAIFGFRAIIDVNQARPHHAWRLPR